MGEGEKGGRERERERERDEREGKKKSERVMSEGDKRERRAR